MTVTPTFAKRSIASSIVLVASSLTFSWTSFPGRSRPASTMRSIAPKPGASMPTVPTVLHSFRTRRSIGTEIMPCSADVVRPICR
jgi:hypothetical protein